MNISLEMHYGRWEDHLPKIDDKTVDLCYTDPPFQVGYVSQIPGSEPWNSTGESDSKFDAPMVGDEKLAGRGTKREQGAIDWNTFAKESYRILKDDRYFIMHTNIQLIVRTFDFFEDAGFTYKGTIAWNKRFAIGGDTKGAMKRDWEQLIYWAKGKPALRPIEVERKGKMQRRKRISEIADWEFQLTREEKCKHPTQKPIALAEQVIRLMSGRNQLVVDAFAGSGTIPLAAKHLGRRSIGIEIDQSYFDIAVQRQADDARTKRAV